MSESQKSVIGDNGILPRFTDHPADKTEEQLIEVAAKRVVRQYDLYPPVKVDPAWYVESLTNDEVDQLVVYNASSATRTRVRQAILKLALAGI